MFCVAHNMHACIRPVLSIKQDVINPTQIGSTEVWGDGNAANGCAPPLRNTASCTDGADYLTAGTVIILEDDVPLPRDTSTLLWDGGDRIQSSFPVAITRGVYSGGEPGSLLGGQWKFSIPIVGAVTLNLRWEWAWWTILRTMLAPDKDSTHFN